MFNHPTPRLCKITIQHKKKTSLAKHINFKHIDFTSYELCNIWRVRNGKCKLFTFTQRHFMFHPT